MGHRGRLQGEVAAAAGQCREGPSESGRVRHAVVKDTMLAATRRSRLQSCSQRPTTACCDGGCAPSGEASAACAWMPVVSASTSS